MKTRVTVGLSGMNMTKVLDSIGYFVLGSNGVKLTPNSNSTLNQVSSHADILVLIVFSMNPNGMKSQIGTRTHSYRQSWEKVAVSLSRYLRRSVRIYLISIRQKLVANG